MAEISLVLFLTIEVEGELRFMVETQESKGHILDTEASGRLLEAVCNAVGQLPPWPSWPPVDVDSVSDDGGL
jgi:hypothetical protein